MKNMIQYYKLLFIICFITISNAEILKPSNEKYEIVKITDEKNKTRTYFHLNDREQLIFENLYNIGIKEYCFVTGKTKRSIQDHFHPDILENSNEKLYEFFKMIEESTLFWTDQLKPKGFGDAVLPSKSFVNNESFMLHAGDVSFLPNHLESLKELYALKNSDVDAAFLVREVSDPERHGIITSTKMDGEFLKVEKIEEKPTKPESNLGVFPLYYFKNSTIISSM